MFAVHENLGTFSYTGPVYPADTATNHEVVIPQFSIGRRTPRAGGPCQAATSLLFAVTDGVSDAVLAYGADGVVRSCNPAAVELFGYHDRFNRRTRIAEMADFVLQRAVAQPTITYRQLINGLQPEGALPALTG